jgi:hypothetical protein
MSEILEMIEEFSQRAINHHKFGLEGDYKRGNAEVKKINKVYKTIKIQGGMEELLKLVDSNVPEVASLAATYCMRYDSEKCIAKLKELSMEEIPLISFEAKHAIRNWNNGEWYID